MSPWETILLALGGNAVLLAALAWLARSLLGQVLAKDMERFKSELTAASTAASDRLKHELQLLAQEHQIVVSRLHEKRAQVVAEVYGLLVESHWAAQDLASLMEWAGEPPKREKYSAAMNKAAEFYRHFDKHRIYLPAALCGQLEEFLRGIRRKVIEFGVHVAREEAAMTDKAVEAKYNAWMAVSEYFDTEAPRARAALEDELRKIIGPPSAG